MIIDNSPACFVLFPLAAYVIGATPFAVIITRCAGIDIRKVGSGNAGATNVGRAMGRRWGILCFVLDVTKGLVPTLTVGYLSDFSHHPSVAVQLLVMSVAAGAVIGHIFSFYLKGRGGKGVATSLGAVLGIYPWFTLSASIAFVVWVVVTGVSRYISLGSIVASLLFLPIFLIVAIIAIGVDATLDLYPQITFAAVISLLIVFKHRTNIRRLIAGEENRMGDDG